MRASKQHFICLKVLLFLTLMSLFVTSFILENYFVTFEKINIFIIFKVLLNIPFAIFINAIYITVLVKYSKREKLSLLMNNKITTKEIFKTFIYFSYRFFLLVIPFLGLFIINVMVKECNIESLVHQNYKDNVLTSSLFGFIEIFNIQYLIYELILMMSFAFLSIIFSTLLFVMVILYKLASIIFKKMIDFRNYIILKNISIYKKTILGLSIATIILLYIEKIKLFLNLVRKSVFLIIKVKFSNIILIFKKGNTPPNLKFI